MFRLDVWDVLLSYTESVFLYLACLYKMSEQCRSQKSDQSSLLDFNLQPSEVSFLPLAVNHPVVQHVKHLKKCVCVCVCACMYLTECEKVFVSFELVSFSLSLFLIFLCLSFLSEQLPADLNKMHLTDHAHQQVMHMAPSQSGCSIASDSGSSSLSDIYQVGTLFI